MRKIISVLLFAALVMSLHPSLPAQAQSPSTNGNVALDVSKAVHYDTSAPLRTIIPASVKPGRKVRDLPLLVHPAPTNLVDPVLQASVLGPAVATTAGLNFAGLGYGNYGFTVIAAPPDTEGTVGATQYVQWVNLSFAVFNKSTGALVYGPAAGNTLWSGFGGGCQNNNDGDPIVQYDKAAQRWIFTQFSISTTPYLQCVAVSTTSDATGSYYRYSFQQPNFPDYPKLGVWPDAYYITFNMFSSAGSFLGGRACAFDRSNMLAGAAATQICFQLSSTYGGLLPADLDGSTPPPSGSPNPLVAFGNDSASLDIWKFHVDFITPTNSTFVHSNIPVPAFVAACSGGGTCIPQSGTSQLLDSLADRLMYRLAYRNFGDHESLVLNHSVNAGTSVGVRWYELRNISGTPTLYQSGTYAPDSNYRWMGSIAMDKFGDIALGYSVSSSSMHPAIRYTGRVPTDALGTLEAENTILNGSGSQTLGLSRWGDYSAMAVDPSDDCTFWYTNEYLKINGTFNWSTQIASFRFPSCSSAPPVISSITVTPTTALVQVNLSQQFNATGYDQYGNLLSPQPAFTWSVSGGGTISSSGLFIAGSTPGGPFTVTASSGGVNGTANVSVTSAPPDFLISVSPTSQSIPRGSTATYTVTVMPQNGFNGQVTLSLSGQPSGSTVTFSPNPATTTSTLTVQTRSNTPKRGYTLTILGASGSLSASASVTLNVTR